MEAGGSKHYSTMDNANGCDCAFTLQTSGETKWVPHFGWYGKLHVRTGPFASNINNGYPFTTENVALSGLTTPHITQNTLTSITPFNDTEGRCSGITWDYQGQLEKTTPNGVPTSERQAQIDITDPTPFQSIKGCFNDRINTISFFQMNQNILRNSGTCGHNTGGIGFNAYPIDQPSNGCKFAFLSGESDTTTNVYLTDVYFYWDCETPY